MGLAVTSWLLVVVLGQVGPVPVAGSPIGGERRGCRGGEGRGGARGRPARDPDRRWVGHGLHGRAAASGARRDLAEDLHRHPGPGAPAQAGGSERPRGGAAEGRSGFPAYGRGDRGGEEVASATGVAQGCGRGVAESRLGAATGRPALLSRWNLWEWGLPSSRRTGRPDQMLVLVWWK